MSKEISKSIEIVEFLNILTHTLETSEEANGVQKVIEIFSSKAHLIITDIPNNEVTQNALLSFASIFAEQSGIDASKNITEINTIAQKHNIPINIGYTESSNNHNDISLKEELVDA